MANYLVTPERQWWGETLSSLGVRHSLTLAAAIALGMALRWNEIRARLVGSFWHSQELLLVFFTILVAVSTMWGTPIDMAVRDFRQTSQLPVEKMPKVAIFVLMLTHLMVRYKDYNQLLWLLVLVGGLYLGLDAYTAAAGRFFKGRLDQLGGADFNEANAAALHLAFVCVITGCLFLRTPYWPVKLACLATGVLSVNAIIMTQSRSALVGLAVGGLAAPILAKGSFRVKVCFYLLIGAIGAYSLTNEYFWARAETIELNPDEASAASRFDLWRAGLAMWADHPFGVGAGRFYTVVGRYNADYVGRDCHNTYIRCAAELGIMGILLLAAMIANAFRTIRRAARLATGTSLQRDVEWDCFGLQVGLLVYLVPGMFIGLTYVEEMWWLLCLPVCLERAILHARANQCRSEAEGTSTQDLVA
jgi:O-antigen ligase